MASKILEFYPWIGFGVTCSVCENTKILDKKDAENVISCSYFTEHGFAVPCDALNPYTGKACGAYIHFEIPEKSSGE